MDFKSWLLAIGKAQGTANKYTSALTGVISDWAQKGLKVPEGFKIDQLLVNK